MSSLVSKTSGVLEEKVWIFTSNNLTIIVSKINTTYKFKAGFDFIWSKVKILAHYKETEYIWSSVLLTDSILK